MADLLKLIAHPTNQAILHHLQAEPSYARRAATILDLADAEVTRRLREMEKNGLVRSEWSYIGKNVKLYRLNASGARIKFGADGISVALEGGSHETTKVVGQWQPRVPIPDDFIGRLEENKLLDTTSVALVEGLAGIGKTTLVAHHVRETDVETVFWQTFRGIESLHWLAHKMAQFLSFHGDDSLLEAVEKGADLADKRDLMLRAIDNPSYTFVFDDVHWIEEPLVKAFITDAINGTKNGDLIVVGRHAIPHNGSLNHIEVVNLEGLDTESVRQLMAGDEIETDDDLLAQMQQAFGGHPLALHLVALASKQGQRPLTEVIGSMPKGELADYLLREVHAGLSDAQRRLLAAASLFRTEWNLEDLQSISTRVQEPELWKLRRHHLVQETAGGYRLHDLVRTFFYDLIDDARPMHAKLAKRLLNRPGVEARLDAMHHLLQAGDRGQVLQLLKQNVDLHELDFVDGGVQDAYLALLDMFTEEEVGNERMWALMEDERGDLYFYKDEMETALGHYETAAAFFAKHPEGTEDEDLAWKRAMVLDRLGRGDEAATLCAKALTTAPENGLARERLEELAKKLGVEYVRAQH